MVLIALCPAKPHVLQPLWRGENQPLSGAAAPRGRADALVMSPVTHPAVGSPVLYLAQPLQQPQC